jgi:uncharacterized protein YjbJ (UPF0337 family)
MDHERTTGGIAGKLIGRAKEAAGALTGKDALAREGRLQEAQADADTEAARAENEAREPEAEAKQILDHKQR